jgi:hypothetical protein
MFVLRSLYSLGSQAVNQNPEGLRGDPKYSTAVRLEPNTSRLLRKSRDSVKNYFVLQNNGKHPICWTNMEVESPAIPLLMPVLKTIGLALELNYGNT